MLLAVTAMTAQTSTSMTPQHVQAGWQTGFIACSKLHAATVPADLECTFSKLKLQTQLQMGSPGKLQHSGRKH